MTSTSADGRNPFEYVRPLPPEDVRGRDGLSDALLRAVRERRLVALSGPRRYGKTSLLGRVVSMASDVDSVDVVQVDCFGVASIGEFAVRLERATAGLVGPGRRLVRRLFETSELGLSVAPGLGFKATFGRRDAPDATAVLHELLGSLRTLSERGNGLLVVLDEFQDVGPVTGLDAILRTHLQAARQVAVLFAGSRPSLLRALFEQQSRPFYGQAEIVEIGRLDAAVAADIVEEGFTATGRDPGDAGELVASLTGRHPQRLMLVSHLLWERVAQGERVEPDQVGAALDDARERTAAEHRAVVDGLDRTHRDTLRAIALHGSPYSAVGGRTLGLARGSAQSAVAALSSDSIIERADDQSWEIVDPLLGDWVRLTFPAPGMAE